eukprot:1478739-Amphidinium_carterae.1
MKEFHYTERQLTSSDAGVEPELPEQKRPKTILGSKDQKVLTEKQRIAKANTWRSIENVEWLGLAVTPTADGAELTRG